MREEGGGRTGRSGRVGAGSAPQSGATVWRPGRHFSGHQSSGSQMEARH